MKRYFSHVYMTVLIIAISMTHCDKVDFPYPPKEVVDTTGTVFTDTFMRATGNYRAVLLEEFTGQGCPNCPGGTQVALQLDSIYGDTLVTVAYYSGAFADPSVYPKITKDLRTPEGENYLTTFNPLAYPSALISRTGNGQIKSVGQWEPALKSEKAKPNAVTLKLTAFYSPSNRVLKLSVDGTFLTALSGEIKLVVILSEDHITDWQQVGANENYSYDHRHVFRKSLNSAWGEVIGNTQANDTFSLEYTTQLPDDWKENDMTAIAYIYNSQTYEVYQVVDVHLH